MSLFFIISPMVIMYTAGYRYDRATRSILETGVISIDIEPNDAVATLNNVRIDKQIPIRLTNRAPGKYSLLLTREGYHSFEHLITVESKQTTYLRDITLFKNTLPILTETPSNILESNTTLYPHPTLNQYLVHTNTEDIHEIGLLSYISEVPEYTALIRAVADTFITLSWSPYASQSVLQLGISPNEIHTYHIDVLNTQVSEPIITDNIPSFHWSEQDTNILYVKHDNASWSAITGTSITELAATNKIPTHESPAQWYIRIGEQTYQHPQFENDILTFSTAVDSIVSIRNNTVLAMQGNTLHRFQKQDAQVTLVESYEEATILVQGTNLLITTPWSISNVDAQGVTTLLLRTSNRISRVTPLAQNRPELVITNSTGIEIFDPRYNMSTELLQNTTVRDTIVAGERQQLRVYFFATIGRQTGMFSLDI